MKLCCFWKESRNQQKWLLCREYLLQVRPWARGFMYLILFNTTNLGGIIPLWPRKSLKFRQLTSGAGEKSCSGHEHLLTASHRHTSPGQLAGHVTAVGTRQRRGRPRRRLRAEKDWLAIGCESGVIGDPAKYVWQQQCCSPLPLHHSPGLQTSDRRSRSQRGSPLLSQADTRRLHEALLQTKQTEPKRLLTRDSGNRSYLCPRVNNS